MASVRARSVRSGRPRGDEVGQPRHIVEEEFGAGRGQMRSFVERREMARADKPEHRHPGGARGGDSRDAVLDHQAVFRRRRPSRAPRAGKDPDSAFPPRPRRRKKCWARTGSRSRPRRSERRSLSCPLEEATHTRARKPSTACRTPSTPFSSRANADRISREKSSRKLLGQRRARVRLRFYAGPNRADAPGSARAFPDRSGEGRLRRACGA